MGDLTRRKGIIMDTSMNGDDALIYAEVPLNNMFGYATILRSNTQVGAMREGRGLHQSLTVQGFWVQVFRG